MRCSPRHLLTAALVLKTLLLLFSSEATREMVTLPPPPTFKYCPHTIKSYTLSLFEDALDASKEKSLKCKSEPISASEHWDSGLTLPAIVQLCSELTGLAFITKASYDILSETEDSTMHLKLTVLSPSLPNEAPHKKSQE